jgi:hypothetical protein
MLRSACTLGIPCRALPESARAGVLSASRRAAPLMRGLQQGTCRPVHRSDSEGAIPGHPGELPQGLSWRCSLRPNHWGEVACYDPALSRLCAPFQVDRDHHECGFDARCSAGRQRPGAGMEQKDFAWEWRLVQNRYHSSFRIAIIHYEAARPDGQGGPLSLALYLSALAYPMRLSPKLERPS